MAACRRLVAATLAAGIRRLTMIGSIARR